MSTAGGADGADGTDGADGADEADEDPTDGAATDDGVRASTDDRGILTVTIDDGDTNVFTPESFDALIGVLDDAPDATAVVVTGREGFLSAGLDLDWMQEHGREGVQHLLLRFGECMVRWWTDPRPTVCAATGHAVAAGTMLAMACDHAVASEDGSWGLTETRFDDEIPRFGIELARTNVRTDRLEDLLLPGRRVDSAEAADVGFCDEVTAPDDVLDRAQAHAAELIELPARAYAGTKQRLRGITARHILDELRDDVEALTEHLDDR